MKALRILGSITILLCMVLTANAQQETAEKVSGDESSVKAKVYYFHLTRRCTTCKTVEAKAKKALEELYPEGIKNGDISFTSINIEEEGHEELIEELGISGQTLMIVKNGNKKDITNEGFLYATTKPEKLKAEIKEAINNL